MIETYEQNVARIRKYYEDKADKEIHIIYIRRLYDELADEDWLPETCDNPVELQNEVYSYRIKYHGGHTGDHDYEPSVDFARAILCYSGSERQEAHERVRTRENEFCIWEQEEDC